jgi:hypothetical protein
MISTSSTQRFSTSSITVAIQTFDNVVDLTLPTGALSRRELI